MYGLKEKHIEAVNSVFSKYPQIEKATLYGSRAKGNYRNGSDIDLTLKGEALTLSILSKIETELDDLLLPYKIDISIHHKIENPDLLEHMDRVGIVFYEKNIDQWKERTLDELAELENNNWKVGDEKMPYIALKHIIENDLRINGIGSSVEVVSNKYHFTSNNFLFGKLRPYFRKLYRPNFKGICSTDIWVIKPKGENDKNFLFYFFANQEFVDQSYSTSGGTRMPRADWKYMSKTKWLFPGSEEQKAIAEVLSSLDDKIDLLHRQNQTLEQMAETLFRQWFIEEADESWGKVKLKDIYSFDKGFESGSKNYFEKKFAGAIRFIRVGDMLKNKGSIYIETNISQNTCNYNDLLVSFDGTIGRVVFGIKGAYSSGIRKIYSDDKAFNNLGFKYILFKSRDIQDEIQGHATGSVILHASSSINFLSFRYKDYNQLINFNIIVTPMFDKIYSNHIQICTLEKLRDTLLPKLMSGEIRVDSE